MCVMYIKRRSTNIGGSLMDYFEKLRADVDISTVENSVFMFEFVI